MWGGISPAENDFEWQSERKNHTKNGFSFAGSHLPCRKFIWPEEFLFSFFHESRIILFASDFFHFTPFHSSAGNLPFSFFLLLFSLFSYFFSFFSFYFFLFFLFTSPSPFLSLGNQVLAFYSLSLEEIPLSFASGERMRILSIGQGSKKSKVVSMGSFIVGTRSSYMGQNKFVCQSVGLRPNFHIIPQGTRNNDDLETTCKICHGHSQVGTQASCLWHCDTMVGNLHKQTQRFLIMFFHQFNEFIHSYLGYSGK